MAPISLLTDFTNTDDTKPFGLMCHYCFSRYPELYQAPGKSRVAFTEPHGKYRMVSAFWALMLRVKQLFRARFRLRF
jgi:hypothetical protein